MAMGKVGKKYNRNKDDNMEFVKDKTLNNDKKYKKINVLTKEIIKKV